MPTDQAPRAQTVAQSGRRTQSNDRDSNFAVRLCASRASLGRRAAQRTQSAAKVRTAGNSPSPARPAHINALPTSRMIAQTAAQSICEIPQARLRKVRSAGESDPVIRIRTRAPYVSQCAMDVQAEAMPRSDPQGEASMRPHAPSAPSRSGLRCLTPSGRLPRCSRRPL